MSLLALVVGSVFGAQLFVTRNAMRLSHVQQQETAARLMLQHFARDVAAAESIDTAATAQMALSCRTAAGLSTVSYVYSPADGTLVRSEAGRAQTLLSALTSFTFAYTAVSGTTAASRLEIKCVECSFASERGSVASGTLAPFRGASTRVIMRNKTTLP